MKKSEPDWKVAIHDTGHKGKSRFEGEMTENGEVFGYVWGKTFDDCEDEARKRKESTMRRRNSIENAVKVDI